MEAKNKKDLEEDEELQALRLAALATLKVKKKQVSNESNTDYASPINKIATVSSKTEESDSSQIPFLQSDRNSHNVYSWRKQNQHNRRRGGGLYPKSCHRSNLIVISPVSLDDSKDSESRKDNEKLSSSLVLPQHKWCSSGNEDSMSPKTLRRTGPTRFNRHGSDSESSESDYEDSDSENDNDSASNETLLQDEPPEHFTNLSPGRKAGAESDRIEQKRRLSFQSVESNIKSDVYDKNETTSVYNCLKNSNSSYNYSDNRPGSYASVQNQSVDSNAWRNSKNSYNSYNQYSSQYSSERLDSSVGFPSNHRNSACSPNGEIHVSPPSEIPVWQNTVTSNSYYTRDNQSKNSEIPVMHEREKYYSDRKNSVPMQNEIQRCDGSWQHVEKPNTQYFSGENSYTNSRNAIDNNGSEYLEEKHQSLMQSDLRLELQKRIQQEYNSKREVSSDRNETLDDERQDQRSRENWSNKQIISKQVDRSEDKFKNSFDQDYDRDKPQNKYTSRRHERSLSYERRKKRSSSREKSRSDFDFNHDRHKHENNYDPKKYRHRYTSNYARNRDERSFSRERNTHEHISQDHSSHERSSSQERSRYEHNSNHNKRFYKRSTSRERNKRDRSLSQDKATSKRSLTPNNSKAELSSSQGRPKVESNLGRQDTRAEWDVNKDITTVDIKYETNLFGRCCSTSSESSRGGRSWSQGSQRSQDYSQNKNKRSLSRDRSRHDRSLSHDRRSFHRSSSRGRSKREHSSSRSRSRSRQGYSPYHTKRCDPSPSRDKSEKNVSPSKVGHIDKDKSGKIHLTPIKYKGQDYESIGEKRKQDSAEEKDKQSIFASGERERSKHQQARGRSKDRRNQYSSSKDKYNKDRSPIQRYSGKSSHREVYKKSRSKNRNSSHSSSSSSTSSSSYTSKPKLRSVPSVIKSVPSKNLKTKCRETSSDAQSTVKSSYLTLCQSSLTSPSKRETDHSKLTTIKSERVDSDQKSNASDSKRMPVHMRLGTFPRKRLIQMTKDVEAAFVNSSSSSDNESVSTKSKRQNLRIFADVSGNKSGTDIEKKQMKKDEPAKNATNIFMEKSRRLKTNR